MFFKKQGGVVASSGIAFGSAAAQAVQGLSGVREAAARARAAVGTAKPALAVVFASATYGDLDEVLRSVARELGDVPIVGGTAAKRVFGPDAAFEQGISVSVIGGDGVRAAVESAPIYSPEMIAVVPAGERLAAAAKLAAADGYEHHTCLAFAPGAIVDGELFIAASRRGVGPDAQLAGGMSGDEMTYDRMRIFADGGIHADRAVLASLFTHAPVGVVAGHGWKPVGDVRTVTASEGMWLRALDGKPAFEVWEADARAAGAQPPPGHGFDVVLYYGHNHCLGVMDHGVVRAAHAIRNDGAVLLAGHVPEGARVRVLQAVHRNLLEGSQHAAQSAKAAAGGTVVGALSFTCVGRIGALGEALVREHAAVERALGAPTGGACVYGEIAGQRGFADAFHNSSVVVVALPA